MDPEIIDISSLNDESFNIGSSFGSGGGGGSGGKMKSTNFGGGIELLMNDKKKENSSSKNDIDIDDLNNLENELNELTDETSGGSRNMFEARSDLFNKSFSTTTDDKQKSVHFDTGSSNNLGSLGGGLGSDSENEKTWDGFTKFNNVPLNPDKPISSQPQLSKEELLREKFKYLRRLETLETKGVTLTKKYSMESPLAEMQGEYEMIMEEKAKQNSVKFQGNMLMACINGIEFLNGRFDPFDIKLDGWGDQINENITDYDDVFAELYDKYKSKASMAPELKLLFQLGGSAMMVHMTNTMFKSAMPGLDDILRQNPDLMRQFQSAAVNTMGQSNPGFSGFMNGIVNNDSSAQGRNDVPAPGSGSGSGYRPGNNNNSRPVYTPSYQNKNDGINIRENFGGTSDVPKSSRATSRAEMKGPSDISDILSGLKTKTINIQEAPVQKSVSFNSQENDNSININDSSTISISDLKDLQSMGKMPSKSKRRQKSDKNTLSLDI